MAERLGEVPLRTRPFDEPPLPRQRGIGDFVNLILGTGGKTARQDSNIPEDP